MILKRMELRKLTALLALSSVLSACSTDGVLDMDGPRPTATLAPMSAPVSAPMSAPLDPAVDDEESGGFQRLVPSDPYLVGYPRMDPPASPMIQLSAEEADCRRQLEKLDVAYTPLAPIDEGGACRIDQPVKVSAIGSVEMRPAATLSCQMALAFAEWTKKELVPSARWRYFSGVRTIHQGSSYSCRKIARTSVASEHSKGNALDVMAIELNNGDKIDVKKPGFFSFRQKGLLNNVRADGCSYFTTVLGPGYNYDHRNHFHFDIKDRRNGYRACR
ncbi:extensin family protein [Mesorhizobium sp. RP14(2022)]|uniref:Extensin family protein n=1 Tax=Mesorhizobium liriopis TaxID=2953882 RepID=A0ABT1C4X8_9HYPH|nr:extensin family protein [Mesorhizobium liriopis]MCO6049887.1 extensin family protein [Mesorhizobium liriopis]